VKPIQGAKGWEQCIVGQTGWTRSQFREPRVGSNVLWDRLGGREANLGSQGLGEMYCGTDWVDGKPI